VSAGVTEGAGRFVGQSVKRREDARLVTGHGRFVEDVQWPDTWHVAFLRSPVARGRIVQLDVGAARSLDGVRAVFTAADLNPMVMSWWQTMIGPDAPQPPRRLLADQDVRWVGEPIAMVLATSRYVAEDAIELIDLDVEPQPPVLSDHLGIWATVDDTELVHPELGTNVAALTPPPGMGLPEENPALDAVLEAAPHVFDETFHQHRYLCVPMETRGIIARWDAHRDQMEVVAATQSAHEIRSSTARLLGISESQVHAWAEDVGGGFGQKMYVTIEEHCVVAAAYREGCTVRWIEDRNENLMAGGHARTEDMRLQMATDESGRILGIKAHHSEDVGAFPLPSVGSNASLAAAYLPGPYDVGQFFFTGRAVYSNTNGKCAYRGPWMMETVAREQMVDVVAAGLGIDPLEFRRRNMITNDQLPFTTATGMVYETVSPRATLDQVAELIGYDAFREEQAAARAEGRLLGIGLSVYIEGSPGFGILGAEQVSLRVDYQGKVLASTGSGSHGQSVETTIAQVVAESLGVDIEDVRVVQNDTASSPFGSGTGGSRTAAVFGGAARLAGEKLRKKVLEVAAVALEASPDDLDMDLGVVTVKGTPGVALPLEQVAALAYAGHAMLPEDMEPGLEAAHRIKAPLFMFSNAAHAAVVEVDRATGAVRVLRYAVSEDCGNMINPMVVEGQIAGGVVQGIGGVFYEHFVYDADGNPLTTTFLDYLLPTAADVPDIQYGHVVTPSGTPGGFKPMGEGGAIVSPPALLNAVRDALQPFGAVINTQPLTPDLLLDLMDRGSGPTGNARRPAAEQAGPAVAPHSVG
jgi:aerobic carbon-monoxide dehydrogenase large subunit